LTPERWGGKYGAKYKHAPPKSGLSPGTLSPKKTRGVKLQMEIETQSLQEEVGYDVGICVLAFKNGSVTLDVSYSQRFGRKTLFKMELNGEKD